MNECMKKTISFVIACTFFITAHPLGVTSLYADDDDPPKAMKLGLDLAKAMAEQKNVKEGLKAVANDELSNWMWDSIGGYEKIVFQNSEAEIPAAKDKIKKIVETVQAIESFAIAMTEGKYDDAAFIAIDQAVGVIDHPLVSVTWAMAKLTYESHKQVQETQAALEIEALYGAMANDRRLMGTINPKSDAPPTIPENAQSADYFFEKYVMTNDATRQMLKSYVTKVLGDEWPEESWSDYAKSWMSIGSGVDTARSAEIEALSTEWRNKGRTWISQLIKDVNKQAKVAWGETRVRQQLAEFQAFVKRVGHFYNNDFEQMLKDFQSIKQCQEALPACQKVLQDAQNAYPAVQKRVKELKPDSMKYIGPIRSQIEEKQLALLSASSKMQLIRENELAQQLSAERKRWLDLDDEIVRFMSAHEEKAADEVENEYKTAPRSPWNVLGKDMNALIEEHGITYYALFEPYLSEFDWAAQKANIRMANFDGSSQDVQITGEPEGIVEHLLNALNAGDFAAAQEIVKFWNITVGGSFGHHFTQNEDAMRKLASTLPSDLVSAQQAVNAAEKTYAEMSAAAEKEKEPLYNIIGAIQRKHSGFYGINWGAVEADGSYQAAVSSIRAIDGRLLQYAQSVLTPLSFDEHVRRQGWGESQRLWQEALQRMRTCASVIFDDKAKELAEMLGVFQGLKQEVGGLYATYKDKYDRVLKELPDPGVERIRAEQRKLNLEDLARGNYSFFTSGMAGSFEAKANVMSSVLWAIAGRIKEDIVPPNLVENDLAIIESLSRGWNVAINEWKEIPEISSDDANKIMVFVDPTFDLLKVRKEIEMRIGLAKEIMSSVPREAERAIKVAQTNQENREKDIDYLESHAKKIDAYFNAIKEEGLIKYGDTDYAIVLPDAGEDGMIISRDPHPHYMTKQELSQITQRIRMSWGQCQGVNAARKYAPQQVAAWERIMNLNDIPAARGENLINPITNRMVYKDDLVDAQKILESIKFPEKNFDKKMQRVAELVPGLLRVMSAKDMKAIEARAKLYGMSSAEEYLQKTTGKGTPPPDYRVVESVMGDLKHQDLQNEIGKMFVSVAELAIKVNNERWDYEAKEQQKKYEEESRAQQEKRDKEEAEKRTKETKNYYRTQDPLGLAAFYGYHLEDIRVNTYSMGNAHGDVVFTQDELPTGQFEITARLATMDRIQNIFISNDDGRTWQELSTAQNIQYSFNPVPDRVYSIKLRIKTTDSEDIEMPFFARNVTGIVFRNIQYQQLVMETLKGIADAYERQDVSGFARYISRDYLGNKTFLEDGVRFDFDMFIDIKLTLYVNRIDRRNDNYIAETKWDKTQVPRKTGEQQRTSGKTTFLFVLEDGIMKIKNLRGNLIYATLSPEIAEASGLPQSTITQIENARDDRNPEQPGAGTTEDAGGIVTSSGSSITIKNATITDDVTAPLNSFMFDFSTDSVVAVNGDFGLETNLFHGGGLAFIKVVGTTFDATTDASGIGGGDIAETVNVVGTVLIFKTADGIPLYGKMEVTGFSNDGTTATLNFKYAVQPDGTTDVTT